MRQHSFALREFDFMRSVAALLLFASFARAQAPTDDSVTRGRKQFAKTCSFCHGIDATGGAEGPSLIRSALVRHDRNGNLIATVIHDGRPSKGMPPVPLTDPQIADVVAFLHWTVDEADKRSPEKPVGYSLQLLLTGNAELGKTYFERHCRSCHSPSGDLAGIARKYEPSSLQARFLYPGDVPKTVSVKTGSGEQIRGTFAYADPFSIALIDAKGWYHSWPRDQVQATIDDPVAGHLRLLAEYSEADLHNIFAYLETLK